MLLKSLRLRNFRQYKGEQRIDFSTDSEKNVTVILGDNTFGKTTLLQSFNWCLYQDVFLDNKDDLLNYDIAESLHNGDSAEVEVEINLIHNSIEYTITTTRVYTKEGPIVRGAKPSTVVCWKKEDGQTENIKESRVESTIKSILPKDLSSYFFFDTERVASVSMRKDLADSVKGLLGLTILDNAIKHIGDEKHKRSVLGQFYLSMDQDGDDKAKEARNRIQAASAERDDIKERIEECDSQISQLSARKDQLDIILRDNQETKDLQEKKQRLEKAVEADTKALGATIAALRGDFSASSLEYFIVPLVDQAEDLLKSVKLDDKGIRDLTRPTLEEILARKVCVCGLCFDEHPEAVEHIREEMRYCPPESIGNAVRNYRALLRSRCGNHDRILGGMSDRRANIYSTTDRIQNNGEEIDILSEKISQKDDLSIFEGERNDIKRQLKTLHAKREGLVRRDQDCVNSIDKYQKIYDKVAVSSKKNKQIMRYIAYAEEIQRWLTTTYSEKEVEVREALEERVNSIFEQMYHGSRRVVIDSKYQVQLLTSIADSERYTGESEGLNRVKNFAFIAGLVSLAKEKIVSNAGEESFDLSSEPYPLVMDAPFSNTDETHIANISKALPEASEQVIMFVMQKDWRYAKAVLGPKVGSSYELEKHSEQHSELRGL